MIHIFPQLRNNAGAAWIAMIVLLGVAALGFALTMVLWSDAATRMGKTLRTAANAAIAASLAVTVTLAAFWRAERVTLVGSTMPAANMSPQAPVSAS